MKSFVDFIGNGKIVAQDSVDIEYSWFIWLCYLVTIMVVFDEFRYFELLSELLVPYASEGDALLRFIRRLMEAFDARTSLKITRKWKKEYSN